MNVLKDARHWDLGMIILYLLNATPDSIVNSLRNVQNLWTSGEMSCILLGHPV